EEGSILCLLFLCSFNGRPVPSLHCPVSICRKGLENRPIDFSQCQSPGPARSGEAKWPRLLPGAGRERIGTAMWEWLYEMTDKLRYTPLVEFSLWVSDWPFALWLQSNFLAIPGFQTLHILAIAVLFSSVLMLNMRIWGFTGKDQGLEAAYRRYVP